MNWTAIGGVASPVDDDVVQEEVEAFLGGRELARVPWQITNLGQADWCMRRLAEARAHEQAYRDEIALWRAALDRVEGAASWFEARLEEWGVGQRTSATKTFPLASGTVSTRESKARIGVEGDETVLIEWARVACPGALRKSERFLVSEVGSAAIIADVIVGFVSIDKSTGESERIDVNEVAAFHPDRVEVLREMMGDGFVVEAVCEQAVVGVDGLPIPGLVVRPATVSATVKPLMPSTGVVATYERGAS